MSLGVVKRKIIPQPIALVLAPLLSLFIMTLGNGLYSTLVSVRLHLDGNHSFIIGVVTAAYYGGFMGGSFRSEHFIARVGHIRAYAAFASMLALVTLLPGIITDPYTWIVFRFVSGFCVAGLYIVIESWVIACGTPTTRGQMLAIYMIALYGAQASGQFLLNLADPRTLEPFSIAAILSSISVIPLSMTYLSSPRIEEPSALNIKRLYRISPSGVLGGFAAGLILGAVYGLLPLYISQTGYDLSDIALFMGLTIFGGMALQYPLGRLSDFISRRTVLLFCGASLLGVSIAILLFGPYFRLLLMALLFVFGGLSFALYPLSISHTCDYVDSEHIVAATQGLTLAYGFGAMVGPVLAPTVIHFFGARGLFIYFAIIAGILAVFFGWRRTQKTAVTVGDQQDFIAMPQTTPMMNEMDPRSEESPTEESNSDIETSELINKVDPL